MAEPSRILVIKLSAFGNIVTSLRPFAAVRAHHPRATITALTTPAYAAWFRTMPYFDHVLEDQRPAWWDLAGVWRLRRLLTTAGFDRVYDLQTSGRSSRYFRLFPAQHRPEWSGIATGCSHPDRDPDRGRMHDVDRQIGQLRQAGIDVVPPLDLSWCHGAVARFGVSGRLALLVPGSSPHRPAKRWPVAGYAALAEALRRRGLTPVVIGAAAERSLGAAIPAAINLAGQTTPGDLADLARIATIAVGNDTGPMHLIAAADCPSLVLFSAASDPARCAPRGATVSVLQRADLATLDVAEVVAALPTLAATSL